MILEAGDGMSPFYALLYRYIHLLPQLRHYYVLHQS